MPVRCARFGVDGVLGTTHGKCQNTFFGNLTGAKEAPENKIDCLGRLESHAEILLTINQKWTNL